MSRRREEPVRHTCPDIDRIKDTIKRIVIRLDNFDEDTDKEVLLSYISDVSSDLYEIGGSNSSELEELRASNHSLREWGREMYEDAEQMEKERDEFECKVSDLERQISQMEDTIYNHENTIEELNIEISHLDEMVNDFTNKV